MRVLLPAIPFLVLLGSVFSQTPIPQVAYNYKGEIVSKKGSTFRYTAFWCSVGADDFIYARNAEQMRRGAGGMGSLPSIKLSALSRIDFVEPTREERAHLSRLDNRVLKANLTFWNQGKVDAAIAKTNDNFSHGYSKVSLSPEDFVGEGKLRLENVFLWFGNSATWLELVPQKKSRKSVPDIKEKPHSLLDGSVGSMTVEVLVDR
jgi:hypothetical protein